MDSNSPRKDLATLAKQIVIASQLPLVLIVPMFAGGGIGYLLDRWLHTKFILMIVFGFVGFGIGLREVLKLAGAADKKNGI